MRHLVALPILVSLLGAASCGAPDATDATSSVGGAPSTANDLDALPPGSPSQVHDLARTTRPDASALQRRRIRGIVPASASQVVPGADRTCPETWLSPEERPPDAEPPEPRDEHD